MGWLHVQVTTLRPGCVLVGLFCAVSSWVCLPATTAAAAAPAVSFAAPAGTPVDYIPWADTAGDFNKDGKADLAVTNTFSGRVYIFLGDGHGNLGAPDSYKVGTDPYAITVADINTDDNLDIVTANSGSNDVSVLLGNGDGSFQPAKATGVGASWPYGVAVGYFDADTDPDVVTANAGSNNVSVLLGNGDGTFAAASGYAVGSNPWSVAVGDFNKDGESDLAVANAGSTTKYRPAMDLGFALPLDDVLSAPVVTAGPDSVSILLGDGLGGFTAGTDIQVGANPSSIIAVDVDSDGDSDLAVANRDANSLCVQLCNGSGGFTSAGYFGVGNRPMCVAAADFNKDGMVDVVTANYNSDNVSVLVNNGTSLPSVSTFPGGQSPPSVAVADFNSDGWPDLATVAYFNSQICILLNTTSSSPTPTPSVTPTTTPTPTPTPATVDRVGPTTKASAASVKAGKKVTLKFTVTDPAPSCGKAKDTIQIKKGKRVIKTIKLGIRPVNVKLTYKYRAKLKKGAYSWQVLATDIAGNAAVKKIPAKLKVK
jgi:FG-GAP-like repeat